MNPIYLITCTHPVYGIHVMPYVGTIWEKDKTIDDRFKEHLKGQGAAPYLRAAIRKYGKEHFRIEQIDAGNTPEQALELEAWWIKRLGSLNKEKWFTFPARNGYNLTAGGRGVVGLKMSDASRMKMSKKAKERPLESFNTTGLVPNPELLRRYIANGGSANRGKKFSAEWKANLSAAHMGQKAWNKGVPQTPEAKAKQKTAWVLRKQRMLSGEEIHWRKKRG